MKKSIYVVVFSILFLSFCKNDNRQAESLDMQSKEMDMEKEGDFDLDPSSKDESSMQEARDIDASSQKGTSLSAIIDGYLAIKNALAENDKEGAAKGGEMMLAAFSNFDMAQLPEAQQNEFIQIMENSKAHAVHVILYPIGHQEHFESLSNNVNNLIALIGTDKKLYLYFCPMYNNKMGAIWFSETEEIKNPYLEGEMPTCGKILKEIN